MTMEYKSIVIKHLKKYEPSDGVLNEAAADGWELISASALHSSFEGKLMEVFYLGRKRTGQMPPAIPADAE
jgi:hypothetical protein